MKKLSILLVLIGLIILSCEKDDWDYRNKYTGDYDFEIICSNTTFEGDSYSGHFVSHETTDWYSGSVKKYLLQTNKIKVDWGTGTLSIEADHVDKNRTLLSVDSEGKLSFPELVDGFLQPAYIHGDTIQFIFYTGNGMAHQLSTSWHVTGLKR